MPLRLRQNWPEWRRRERPREESEHPTVRQSGNNAYNGEAHCPLPQQET